MSNAGSFFDLLAPFVFFFAIFYFLVIRPQQKQQKQHKSMLSELQKGDKIVSSGGLICTVIKAEEDFIKVSISDGVIVKLDKSFVSKKID